MNTATFASPTSYHAVFRCINGCDGEYPLTDIIYDCPSCGKLLEVVHHVSLLQMKNAREWRALFEKRYMTRKFPYGSGVWAKKEIVCPNIPDRHIVSCREGLSNLFWADRLAEQWGMGNDLWIKDCGTNHTGSFKDLGMTVLVSMVHYMRNGLGKNIPAVACASTGDTSASLAAYCARARIPAIVFLPKGKVTPAQLLQPRANGAHVMALDTNFDGCMKIVQEITSRRGIYLANSKNSLRVEGQKTIAFEIVQEFDWQVPDYVIIPGGNLGNVSAIGAGFLMMKQLGLIKNIPRICCAQAERANPLYQSSLDDFRSFHPVEAQPTQATAIQIGNPVSHEKAIRFLRRWDGMVEEATEREMAEAAAEADRTGLFCCPQTAVALAATKKLVDRGVIETGAKVVVIATASGLKFTGFKSSYLDPGSDNGTDDLVAPVHELPAIAKDVENAVMRLIDKAN